MYGFVTNLPVRSKMLLSLFPCSYGSFPLKITSRMRFSIVTKLAASLLTLCICIISGVAQSKQHNTKSQEVSEVDGIPVLIKHLPDWENVRSQAAFTTNANDLRLAVGEKPVLDLIDFTGGTEAATASYPAG